MFRRPSVFTFLTLAALLSCYLGGAPTPAVAQENGIVAPGAELTLLADSFKFTEGPATDAEGNVFFTDQPNNKIYKWSVDGKLSVFLDSAGRANGLYFDKAGNLWACADLKNELWKITPSGEITVVVTEYDGKRLNGPNDLWIDPKGGIYFTDPFYKRDYWDHDTMEQDGQHVYYLAPDHKKLTRVIDDFAQPNGIIGTPDGKELFVVDIRGRKTWVYDIIADATLTNKKLFTEMGSDGMTRDNEGNVYLVGKGVTVFNSSGEQIDHIDVPEGWTANITFGGKDNDTLFITAMDSLYSIKTRVHGQ
jgi:gluconolactonase